MSKLSKWINQELCSVVSPMESSISRDPLVHAKKGINIANKDAIVFSMNKLLSLLFPWILGRRMLGDRELNLFLCDRLRYVIPALSTQSEGVLNYVSGIHRMHAGKKRNKATLAVIGGACWIIASIPRNARVVVETCSQIVRKK